MTSDPQAYAGHRILEAMREAPRYADAVYRMIRRHAPGPGRSILDFGAGEGAFVERFRRDGYTVDAVEPDRANVARLSGLADRVVEDVAMLDSATYAFAYTVNVLEHLENLEGFVGHLHRVLEPGGRLFVFVPAFDILWTSLDDEVEHVQRFTRASLAAPLRAAGFAIEQLRYFDSAGFAAALAVRGLELVGAFSYSGSTVGFYDRYILPVSLIGDRLLSGVVGKNVVAVARRP